MSSVLLRYFNIQCPKVRRRVLGGLGLRSTSGRSSLEGRVRGEHGE